MMFITIVGICTGNCKVEVDDDCGQWGKEGVGNIDILRPLLIGRWTLLFLGPYLIEMCNEFIILALLRDSGGGGLIDMATIIITTHHIAPTHLSKYPHHIRHRDIKPGKDKNTDGKFALGDWGWGIVCGKVCIVIIEDGIWCRNEPIRCGVHNWMVGNIG